MLSIMVNHYRTILTKNDAFCVIYFETIRLLCSAMQFFDNVVLIM